MIQATLRIIKNNNKNQISYSTSQHDDGTLRSYNLTGTLVALDNYFTADGQDLSETLVQASAQNSIPTTVIIKNLAMGEALLEKIADIYDTRILNGDKNPAIELHVTAKSLRVPSNIIIDFVTKTSVDANVSLQDTSATVLANLSKPRSPLNQMANATAPANSTNNLLARTSGFIKKYF